jgi:hypothetical protein
LARGDLDLTKVLVREMSAIWPNGRVAAFQGEAGAREAMIEGLRSQFDDAVQLRRLRSADAKLKELVPIAGLYRFADGKRLVDLQSRIDPTLAAADARIGQAQALLRADPEQAEDSFAGILALVADHERALNGLLRCPPKRPTGVRACMAGRKNEISWQPSASPGIIEYIVVRTVDRPPANPREGTIVAQTAETHAEDSPVGGVAFLYSVFATRNGNCSSAATSVPIAALLEVDQFELHASNGSASGTWHALPATATVRVTRKKNEPPVRTGDGIAVATASPTGFHDSGLENGCPYFYRVAVEYHDADDAIQMTNGVVAQVTPLAPPEPVLDLQMVPSTIGIALRWTPPAHCSVQVFRSDGAALPAGWQALVRKSLAELPSLGEPLLTSAGGSSALDPAPSQKRCVYFPVSIAGDQIVVGRPCQHLALAEVDGLEVQDFGAYLQLHWHWPAGCDFVRVAWRNDQYPDGPEDAAAQVEKISRGDYQLRGGFRVERPDPQPHWFIVFTGGSDGGQEVFGGGSQPGCHARIERAPVVELRYSIRSPLLGRGRLKLVVESNLDLEQAPRLVLVQGERVQPQHISEGRAVLHTESAPLRKGKKLEAVFSPSPGKGFLRLFVEDLAAASRFRLIPLDMDQLKVG